MKGLTHYQLIDGYNINGADKTASFEFADVGDIIAIHVKTYLERSDTLEL